MAVTTETMPGSSEWIQFYQQHLSGEAQSTPSTIFGDRVSDSTVVTTTFTSTSVPSPRGSGGSDHLSPDGRVSKPIRRRSRASRRTPTTLLNTDTTNFRAMVQQFTGGPNHQALTTGFQHFPSGANFSFGQGNHVQQIVNPAAAAAAVAANRYPLQFQQQQQLRTNDQQVYHQQVENQPYLFGSMNNVNHVPADAFLQRLENSRRTSLNDSSSNNNINNNNNNNNNML